MSHKLEVINGQVYLDGFKIKDVTDYELKSSASSDLVELTLKLVVKDSKLILNKGSNNVDGNLT